VVVGRGGSVV